MKLLELTNDRKSYITGVVIGLYSLLQAFNVIATTQEQDLAVYGFLFALLGMSMRHGISKLKK